MEQWFYLSNVAVYTWVCYSAVADQYFGGVYLWICFKEEDEGVYDLSFIRSIMAFFLYANTRLSRFFHWL